VLELAVAIFFLDSLPVSLLRQLIDEVLDEVLDLFEGVLLLTAQSAELVDGKDTRGELLQILRFLLRR